MVLGQAVAVFISFILGAAAINTAIAPLLLYFWMQWQPCGLDDTAQFSLLGHLWFRVCMATFHSAWAGIWAQD